jgi:hypothetical protein
MQNTCEHDDCEQHGYVNMDIERETKVRNKVSMRARAESGAGDLRVAAEGDVIRSIHPLQPTNQPINKADDPDGVEEDSNG